MSERRRTRVRITFRVEEPVKYISHLDLLRAWERILRRAGLPLAYSQGFHPHPRITIAMPLPVGCTGESELVDILLDGPLPADDVDDAIAALEPALPTGISVVALEEVSLKDPALPSTISCAVYQAVLAGIEKSEVKRRVADLMDRDTFQVEFRRRTYDIRSLIGSLILRGEGDRTVLEATLLRNQRGRIGRPDVLLEALGLSAHARRVHRVRIIFGAGLA